jgi:dienelactone hydrolase
LPPRKLEARSNATNQSRSSGHFDDIWIGVLSTKGQSAMPRETFETIDYASEGRPLSGLLFRPAGALPRPGILVLHGGVGRGEHEEERARRLADLGYVAFAPDLFGEVFTSRARGVEVIGALVAQPALLRDRVGAALAALRALPGVDASRTAAIGFCFGGLAALELARSGADVRCVVSFHGGLSAVAPAAAGTVQASILICTGAADPHVLPQHRAAFESEMTDARADWQMHVHAGAMHAFTVRDMKLPGCAYQAAADRRSWQAMRDLFDETLGPASPR